MPVTSTGGASGHEADAARRRDEGMSAVIDAYQAPLLRYTSRLLSNVAAAQDVVQNTLVKLFRQWQPGMQADETKLRNWLFRVAHNEAVDWIRAEARRRRLHGEHAEAVGRETGGLHVDQPVDERTEMVMRGLGALDPAQRQVILLRLQQGMSYEQIAAVTGRSSGYVGTLLHLAVRRLAVEVRQQEKGAAS